MSEVGNHLQKIANNWFDIYEKKRLKGDVNMLSPEVSKLVGGTDNHISIIMYYEYMKNYMENKK